MIWRLRGFEERFRSCLLADGGVAIGKSKGLDPWGAGNGAIGWRVLRILSRCSRCGRCRSEASPSLNRHLSPPARPLPPHSTTLSALAGAPDHAAPSGDREPFDWLCFSESGNVSLLRIYSWWRQSYGSRFDEEIGGQVTKGVWG